MTLMSAIEVAIGLTVVYFLMSVLCSGLNEYVAYKLGSRGKHLRVGLTRLIADRWVYLRIINHPMLATLFEDRPGKPRHPAYIPPRNFSAAIVDTELAKATQLDPALRSRGQPGLSVEQLRAAVAVVKSHGYSIGDALLPLVDAAARQAAGEVSNSLERVYANIEAWYNGAMDRSTERYKHATRRALFHLGLAAAVLFNVDSIEIGRALIKSPALRAEVVAAAEQIKISAAAAEPAPPAAAVQDAGPSVAPQSLAADSATAAPGKEKIEHAVAQLRALEQSGLPIGFACMGDRSLTGDASGLLPMLRDCWREVGETPNNTWLLKIIGWFITALAVSLGAPFWFDLLSRFVNLRGGVKPAPAK
jgi:hypothetical protein